MVDIMKLSIIFFIASFELLDPELAALELLAGCAERTWLFARALETASYPSPAVAGCETAAVFAGCTREDVVLG
jgi:hypothetical protein